MSAHIPRLELCDKGRVFYVHCVKCNKQVIAGDVTMGDPGFRNGVPQSFRVYADLDGAPFKDYYCAPCAQAALPQEATCTS
jgi:hypothetical protein